MISQEQADAAVQRMTAMKFFPAGAGAQTEIAWQLVKMVADEKQLNWLVDAMIERAGEWPGTRELRAVFCTRYQPRDGIEEWSQLAGFTALDSEGAHQAEICAAKRAELEAPRSERGLTRAR